MTATAVAHKVSFSPASVDFGIGLLVMREQCNKMGTCGLGTEKVGLPIEKALTVKNEGTVSVSLTLNTAAPYKVVSVLPTLSPGQSAQVILRFDPSESGSFTGTVQVGINGGQGSVTAPLVGIAHKIEISPAVLDFGIVFVGSTKERKLTVKNQGVTTVTLEVPNITQNTASPFIVMLESPLVLAPGESKSVPVRFTSPSSNVFSSTIRLTAGSTPIDVPVVARAMTREEYIQQAVIAYNAAVQQGGYGAMYVQDENRGLVLAGFPSLSADEVTGFLGMFDQLSSPEGGEIPHEVAQALEILNSISEEQLEEWLWALVLAERSGQFEQEYARLLSLGFDRVVQALQLITGESYIEVKAKVHDLCVTLAGTNANSLAEAIQLVVILEQPSPHHPHFDIYDKAREIFLAAIRAGLLNEILRYIPPGILRGVVARILFIVRFLPDYAATLLADIFFDRIMEAYAAIWNNPHEGPEVAQKFIEDIKTIVRHLASRIAESPQKILTLLLKLWFEVVEKDLLSPAFEYVRQEALALIRVAANSIAVYGWDLVDIRRNITGRDGKQYTIDLMLYKVGLEIGEGVRNTLSMINFYGCPGGRCSEEMLRMVQDRIAGELGAIMNNFNSLLQEYNADFGIVGLVILDPTTAIGDDGLQDIFNRIQLALIANGDPENAAIFLIWTDKNNQLWFTCFGKGCNQMTPSQRKREACRMAGKRPGPGCGAKEWVRQEAQELPPPPPDDDEGPVEWTP